MSRCAALTQHELQPLGCLGCTQIAEGSAAGPQVIEQASQARMLHTVKTRGRRAHLAGLLLVICAGKQGCNL